MATNPTQNRRKAYSYVRMSTDAQLKGDSLRRQLENSSRFVAEHDLELVDDLRDLGVSAFRGANVEYGALGKFIQAVRNGHIEAGSYLIVEAFDRISRQPTRIALQLTLELINSGITVVTLHNMQVYSSENYDTQQLIISIIEMSTAAEESAKKSQRVRAAWQSNRDKIETRKLTSRGPAWLSYSEATKQFEPIQERANVVHRIFDEAIIGIGAFTIARRLNDERVPTFGKSGRWQPSSVNKIITSSAVIGEFQLHRDEGGKRVTVGEPVKGYFPAVVTDEIYYSAQAARLGRKTTGGGRKGKYVSNVFAKLVYCYYCGGRMLFEDKGDGPKGNTYFVCMSVPSGSDCVRTRWRYDDFEASFLAFVQQVDLGSIFSAEKDAAKRAALEAEMTSLRGERLMLMEKRDKVFELSLDRNMDVDYLAGKLREFDILIKQKEDRISASRSSSAAMSDAAAQFYDSGDKIRDLIDRVKMKNAENYKTRAQIASRLRSLVDRVEVAAVGQARSNARIAKFLDRTQSDPSNTAAFREKVNEVRRLQEETIDDRQNLRFFTVSFKDGTTQIIWPSADDPIMFEQKIAPVYELDGQLIQVT